VCLHAPWGTNREHQCSTFVLQPWNKPGTNREQEQNENSVDPPRDVYYYHVLCVHSGGYFENLPCSPLTHQVKFDILAVQPGRFTLSKKFASYEEPKPIDKELTEKEANFIVELVDNHREPIDAFFASGYACKQSRNHANNRAKRVQRHLWLHIEKRIKEKVSETATLAVSVLESLMREADSENVRLNAARDILSRAGYDAVHKQETTVREITELSDKELDEQIERLSNVVKLSG
jgi:hypothetical protein